MEIKESKTDDIVTLELKGKLDSVTSSNLDETISRLLAAGNKKLILNLTDLNYISSAGLRVFLGAAKKLQYTKGRMTLANLRNEVKNVFDICGFTPLFEFFSSQQDALNSLQK